MKVAVAGKGGVGKTFIAGTLARLFARGGYRVLAIDADPAMNLAYALGVPPDVAENIVPIAENDELVEERTGARKGSSGAIFSLTPRVSDIAERYGVHGPEGTRLLVMGTVKSGGTGCMCPANALLRALLGHLLIQERELVVMDMEAGLEHLGRGVAKGFEELLNVVEPSAQSVVTALRIRKLALDLGVQRMLIVANKVRNEGDECFLKNALKPMGMPLFAVIPFDDMVAEADMKRVAPIDYAPSCPAVKAVENMAEALKKA